MATVACSSRCVCVHLVSVSFYTISSYMYMYMYIAKYTASVILPLCLNRQQLLIIIYPGGCKQKYQQ